MLVPSKQPCKFCHPKPDVRVESMRFRFFNGLQKSVACGKGEKLGARRQGRIFSTEAVRPPKPASHVASESGGGAAIHRIIEGNVPLFVSISARLRRRRFVLGVGHELTHFRDGGPPELRSHALSDNSRLGKDSHRMPSKVDSHGHNTCLTDSSPISAQSSPYDGAVNPLCRPACRFQK